MATDRAQAKAKAKEEVKAKERAKGKRAQATQQHPLLSLQVPQIPALGSRQRQGEVPVKGQRRASSGKRAKTGQAL